MNPLPNPHLPGPRPPAQHPPPPAQRKSSLRLHIALFAATFFTTAVTYAWNIQQLDVLSYPALILVGVPYAVALMAILLCHECGHYFFARAYRVDATPPFFMPLLLPPIFFHFGTVGAFIRMRTLPPNRRALFDIGAAGPWGGFLVAVPAVIIGLLLSDVRPLLPSEGGLLLGDSLLFSWLISLVLGVDPLEVTILLHPIALAGWFGFLLTSINLLPIGQLDGGHVAYAIFGRHHRWISRGAITFLCVLAIGVWQPWALPIFMFMILGLGHPAPWDNVTPLDRKRVVGVVLTLLVLIMTFVPVPAEVIQPLPVFEGDAIPVSAPDTVPAHGVVFRL